MPEWNIKFDHFKIQSHVADKPYRPFYRDNDQLWGPDVFAEQSSVTFSIRTLQVDGLRLLIGPEQIPTEPVTS